MGFPIAFAISSNTAVASRSTAFNSNSDRSKPWMLYHLCNVFSKANNINVTSCFQYSQVDCVVVRDTTQMLSLFQSSMVDVAAVNMHAFKMADSIWDGMLQKNVAFLSEIRAAGYTRPLIKSTRIRFYSVSLLYR